MSYQTMLFTSEQLSALLRTTAACVPAEKLRDGPFLRVYRSGQLTGASSPAPVIQIVLRCCLFFSRGVGYSTTVLKLPLSGLCVLVIV